MKIVCSREKLLSAFQVAASVAPARSPMPILQNVRFEVTAKEVQLSATDTEIGARVNVIDDCDIQRPGRVLLPVARFGSILREMSDDKLRLEMNEKLILVKGERSVFRLPVASADEFPEVPVFDEAKYFEVPCQGMRELIRRTLFATDTESGRYALGGVLLEFGEGKVVGVATDGRRLAKMEAPCAAVGGATPSEGNTIIPSRAMQLIERSLGDGEGQVQLISRGNDILVRTPRSTIFARLVEGRFPRWRDVIPSEQADINLVLPVGPVFSALRQVAIVADAATMAIDLTFADGTMTFASSSAETGEAKVDLPVPYTGESLTISLNHRFVADFLKVCEVQENFTLCLNDSSAPAVFRKEDGYTYLVMPLSRDPARM